MSEKHINYLSRDYESIKEELIKFSKQYYPELSDDFVNDSLVGNWFMDLIAAASDDLSYAIDRASQETNVNSATLRSTVLNLARTNGLKIPSKKASMCEVELSCTLPPSSGDISFPNWDYAPIVQRTSIVAAGNYTFELSEDVNFAEQFNSDGYSNRTFVPVRDSNGNVSAYTVTKSTLAHNSVSKVYKKVLYPNDIKPFMEIVLPEENVMNVESIIFKETSDYTISPKLSEYYVDEEMFKIGQDAVMTYRYFETDSLADIYRYGTSGKNINDFVVAKLYDCEAYVDETENGYLWYVSGEEPSAATSYFKAVERAKSRGLTICDVYPISSATENVRTTRYYKGQLKPLKQKFITEFTDNGYLKIIFGAGNSYAEVPSGATQYAKYRATKMYNNDMLGVLPKEGWTMFVLYRVGGGINTNLAPNSINQIALANVDWSNNSNATNGSIRGKVVASLSVTNTSSAICGKDAPSVEEIKALMKYNTSSQGRAVTLKDYKAKLMLMPPKYGCAFRCGVSEYNNKVLMSFLGLDPNGNLDPNVPSVYKENVIEYMKQYKHLGDYIEIRSGKIYNIGIGADVFIDKNYNAVDVIPNVINVIYDYFDVNNHDIGDEIFIGDLMKEVNLVDGVMGLIDLRIYNIIGGNYGDECPLPTKNDIPSSCDTSVRPTFKYNDGSHGNEIDLQAIDNTLVNDFDSMFEIKDKTNDIQIRVKNA